jgi:hypothetical protein
MDLTKQPTAVRFNKVRLIRNLFDKSRLLRDYFYKLYYENMGIDTDLFIKPHQLIAGGLKTD